MSNNSLENLTFYNKVVINSKYLKMFIKYFFSTTKNETLKMF